MAGFINCAILIVFLLAIAPPLPHPIQYVPFQYMPPRPRDHISYFCTMLVAAVGIWILPGAHGGGRLFHGLLLLGVGLSAASCLLLLAPVAAYTMAGRNGAVTLAVAGGACVAAGAGVRVVLMGAVLLDRLA